MFKKIFLSITIAWLITGNICGQGLEIKEIFFDTPEEAIEYYIDKVKQQDLFGAFAACGIDTMANGLDYREYVKRFRAITATMDLPNEFEIYKDMNRLRRMSFLSFTTGVFIRSFAFSESLIQNSYTTFILPENPGELDQIIEEWDPSHIEKLKIIKIALPSPKIFNGERNQRNMNKMASNYGAQRRTERIILLELKGKYYYTGFSLLQYKGKWCVESLSSLVGNTAPSGEVRKCDLAHFENLTN